MGEGGTPLSASVPTSILSGCKLGGGGFTYLLDRRILVIKMSHFLTYKDKCDIIKGKQSITDQ